MMGDGTIEAAFWLALLGAFCLLFGLAGMVYEKFFTSKVVVESADRDLFLRLHMGEETVSLFYCAEGKETLISQIPRKFQGTAVFYKEHVEMLVKVNN